MVFILQTKLKLNKSILYSLQSIFGVGSTRSSLICKLLGFSLNLKASALNKTQIIQLLKVIKIKKLILSNDLKKLKVLSLQTLTLIKSYKNIKLSL